MNEIESPTKEVVAEVKPKEVKKPVTVAFFTLTNVLPNKQTTFVLDKDKDGKDKTTGRYLTLNTATYKLKSVVNGSGPVEGILANGSSLQIVGLYDPNWKVGDILSIEIKPVE
jgi:hypothetical protein